MLQAGGAAYLPTRLVEPYIKNKQLFRVNDAPDMHRDVFASYHKDNVKTDLMEEVVALFKRTGSQVAPSLIPE
jgi:DNA-binding transcriptional LysR family regulator